MGTPLSVAELWHRVTKAATHPYVVVGLLVLIWYLCGMALSFYNKLLLGHDTSYHVMGEPFPAPLFMSGVQFAMQHMLAQLVFASGLVTREGSQLSWGEWLRNVVPNGTCTGCDIGFSNMSLVFISLSFYTMCKATVPLFLLGFAFLWGLETPTWRLGGVVTTISAGLALLVSGEADFHLMGFLLVMTAAVMSGLRFTLTQVFLQGAGGKHSLGGPLEVLAALTPVMSCTVLLLSLAWEQLWVVLPQSAFFSTLPAVMLSMGLILMGAVIAFALVWTEYKLIRETSALTFMIAGTLKEIVTVLAAIIFLGDEFGWINALGLAIVVVGVVLFKVYKLEKIKKHITILPHEPVPNGSDGGSGSGGGGAPSRDADIEMEPLIAAGGSSDSGSARGPGARGANGSHSGAAGAANGGLGHDHGASPASQRSPSMSPLAGGNG